uniref:Uncharacterized protein n=1 Tax=Entomoneis paludosa TaxID=265537 RepID=A0A7S2YGE0_9STRA|mmetsp:Transcript_32063/g.66947  ORF Transcript_32063/g.66947 Transcript_32063/m.66947 type:complete len:422 (+) Transcript_32063:61-1326(+)
MPSVTVFNARNVKDGSGKKSEDGNFALEDKPTAKKSKRTWLGRPAGTTQQTPTAAPEPEKLTNKEMVATVVEKDDADFFGLGNVLGDYSSDCFCRGRSTASMANQPAFEQQHAKLEEEKVEGKENKVEKKQEQELRGISDIILASKSWFSGEEEKTNEGNDRDIPQTIILATTSWFSVGEEEKVPVVVREIVDDDLGEKNGEVETRLSSRRIEIRNGKDNKLVSMVPGRKKRIVSSVVPKQKDSNVSAREVGGTSGKKKKVVSSLRQGRKPRRTQNSATKEPKPSTATTMSSVPQPVEDTPPVPSIVPTPAVETETIDSSAAQEGNQDVIKDEVQKPESLEHDKGDDETSVGTTGADTFSTGAETLSTYNPPDSETMGVDLLYHSSRAVKGIALGLTDLFVGDGAPVDYGEEGSQFSLSPE